MFKKFLMKQVMKSQLKGVPESEQNKILEIVEKNPDFFQNIAKELQDSLKSGKDQNAAMLEIMSKHKDELGDLLK